MKRLVRNVVEDPKGCDCCSPLKKPPLSELDTWKAEDGDYRVVYLVDDESEIVFILKVGKKGHRSTDFYRDVENRISE